MANVSDTGNLCGRLRSAFDGHLLNYGRAYPQDIGVSMLTLGRTETKVLLDVHEIQPIPALGQLRSHVAC